ncbi:MAG: sulfatase family protein [Acidimicrobiales bacterium]
MPLDPATPRPNIVLVVSDDHAQWALGCYGAQEISTPNLDRLAAAGARFANAYTPTPVCSPGRACLFTGRLPSQHGVHDFLREMWTPADREWLAGELTMPMVLHEAGYETALFGKWHCGRSHLPQPGFDHWLSYALEQLPHDPHCGELDFVENGDPIHHQGCQAPFLTAKAIDLLRARDRSRPLFLCLGYTDTHSPFAGLPERLVSRFRDCAFIDAPLEPYPTGRGWATVSVPPEIERREWLAQLYAGIALIDEQMGMLVDEIDSGDHGETLIVYTSDHGHNCGHHGLFTAGNASVPQNFFEESIRIPLLVHWPEQATPSVLYQPVDHCDLFLTLLEAADCRPPDEVAQDRCYPGESCMPLLGEEGHPWRDVQFCEYGNARMIRTDRYKLVRHYPPHAGVYPDELYDLQADPRETTNLSADSGMSPLVAALDERIEAHFAQHEDPLRSAKRILDQPSCNPYEPWRLESPEMVPPGWSRLGAALEGGSDLHDQQ